MAAQLNPLSASVTRILSLSGFPSELKTRDIQSAFADWENVNGGFKIKWRDDTSLLIVFADAATAKRAYLQAIAQPPAAFGSPTSSKTATIRPYDGPDAQQVITAVNARAHQHSGSRGHHSRSSISSPVNGGGGRNNNGNGNNKPHQVVTNVPTPLNGLASIPEPLSFPRDHSPTLPNVPAHPTLSSLINLSLSPGESGDVFIPPAKSAAVPIVAPDSSNSSTPSSESPQPQLQQSQNAPPRIGDPGRRMVGHALGIRHPGLSSTGSASGASSPGPQGVDALKQVQRGLSGLSVGDD